MRIAFCIALLVALAPYAATAAAPKEKAKERDCQTIKSVTVRQACLDRQTAENPDKKPPDMGDAVESMKREDDLLARKLRGICRGC